MIYFISGHTDLTEEEFLEHYVPQIQEALDSGPCHFVIGDAKGADTLAQEYLYNQCVEDVLVFHMLNTPRNNPGNYPTMKGFSSDITRDEALTIASDEDIAWVRPGREKSGTAKNLARRMQK